MPPLPLARELSTRSLPPRPDLRFILRLRERNLNVTRVATAFRSFVGRRLVKQCRGSWFWIVVWARVLLPD